MKPTRLALRDLFWLVLLAAIAVAWFREHRSSSAAINEQSRYSSFRSATQKQHPSASALARIAACERLSQLTNAQLDEHLREILTDLPNRLLPDESEYEPCLIEMTNRKMVDELQQHYDELMKPAPERRYFPDNFELLAALRRAEGKPDPLRIAIRLNRQTFGSSDDNLPVRADVINVDRERQCVDLKMGGDDLSGRHDRWRVHLFDESGQQVPDSLFLFVWNQGTLQSIGPLDYGDAWPVWLDPRNYVKPPASGRYHLQLVHSRHSIADVPDLTGMIVLKSEPIAVIVTNRDEYKLFRAILPQVCVIGIAMVVAVAVSIYNLLHNRPLPSRRDKIAFSIVLALATAWLIASWGQNKALLRLQADRDADWSMELAE